jgi:DNA-directed RNA polymerase subunit beta'
MISQIRIVDSGDTDFLPSTVMSINKFTEGNRDVILQGKKPAIGQLILLGITKSSLQTDSFLASASFQETTRILTEAAVKGNVDHLHGLKENVIIGKLIPAGTGAKEYMDIGFSLEKEFFDDEPAEVLEEEFLDE